jgi:hypothetical protein
MQGIRMFDRAEDHYMIFDVDGTVSAARQRAVEMDLAIEIIATP